VSLAAQRRESKLIRMRVGTSHLEDSWAGVIYHKVVKEGRQTKQTRRAATSTRDMLAFDSGTSGMVDGVILTDDYSGWFWPWRSCFEREHHCFSPGSLGFPQASDSGPHQSLGLNGLKFVDAATKQTYAI
jgi:hypothetical protein